MKEIDGRLRQLCLCYSSVRDQKRKNEAKEYIFIQKRSMDRNIKYTYHDRPVCSDPWIDRVVLIGHRSNGLRAEYPSIMGSTSFTVGYVFFSIIC